MKESKQAGSTRREFIRRTVWAGAGLVVLARPLRGADAAEPLPTRVLGRTGAKVTILGLGAYPVNPEQRYVMIPRTR